MKKSIFDEKVYLNQNVEALKDLKNIKDSLSIKYLTELLLCSDILDEYNLFIDKVIKLLKTMNLKNSIEYSIALNYLIQNGYLSNGLAYNKCEPSKELSINYGINIIMGEGVCRNFSDFHKSVMENLNEYVKRFYCTHSISMLVARKMQVNHVLNLIKYENALYGIDLCNNNRLYKFVNPFILKEISFFSNSKYRYKPYYEIFTEDKSIDEIKKQISIFEKDINKKHLSIFEYEVLYEKTIKNIMKYQDTFMSFHNETKDIKKDICEGMNKKLVKK